MSPAAPPRKRSKTFTGCWTCRARKIKCDEAKPECHQCSDKGVHCEGYSARLQWLTPATHERRPDTEDPLRAPINQSLRRLLPTVPPQSILKWNQIDHILDYLDSLEPGVNHSEDISASIKNFGVFSLDQQSAASRTNDRNIPSPASGVLNASEQVEFEHPCDSIAGSRHLPTCSEAQAPWPIDTGTAVTFSPCQQTLESANIAAYITSGDDSSLHLTPPDVGPEESHDLKGFIPSDHGDGDPTNQAEQYLPLLGTVTNSLVIPPQERYLMSHYSNQVVNLFCVIDNAKSPWKTIHLPRVLQCAGEQSFGATTTRIRDALRKCLLSISAFYLSNEHRANHRDLDAKNWGTVASRYRCDAIGLLKYAVETDLYADRRPKYKEFLATMLSMITINVMSGDTSTCSVHLDGAERLINFMNDRKATYSRKAKSLHRIYLYLRVIYESTASSPPPSGASRFSPSLGCTKTFGPEAVSPNHARYIEDENSPAFNLPLAESMMTDEGPLPGLSSYECIYGIPLSLLILLKETIEVIDQVKGHHADTDILFIPDHLAQICDEIEQKIMDWPLKDPLDANQGSRNRTSVTIIYHQTRAFLNALIIYFSQGVRFMSHRYLRQYVDKILDSIEAIEQLKAETKVLAAPLLWPAFMGAVEAFDHKHQERFRQWYARVEVYGIEATRTGIKVVHEVWRRGPANYRERTSGWREVVKQGDECLMLT